MNRRPQDGFTLLELMMVLVVVGILASVAYPSYRDTVRESRRADGAAALARLQLAQQKLRSSCPHFAENLGANDVCGANAAASTVKAPAASPDGRYAITLSGASSTGYTATATGQGDQANDSEAGVTCTLVLAVSAANPNGARTPADCWN